MASKKIILIGLLLISGVVPIMVFLLLPEQPEQFQWLENPSFNSSIQSPWFILEEGDFSDIDANIGSDQANFLVLGEIKTFNGVSGRPNSSTSLGWEQVRNGDFLFPDVAVVNDSGCFVYHYLNENAAGGQVRNYPSVHWKKNVSMPVDMSDYKITSASISVIFNASVSDNVDTPNDSYVFPADPDQFDIGDDVTYYVELSDLNNSYSFRVGEFKSEYLGQYNPPSYPAILNITDRDLNYVNDQDLIAALSSILETDGYNFTITLGMDIYCEDNDGSGDHDTWNALIIKTCDLNFTYEKKIDLFTKISWNQEVEGISGENVQIRSANLNFKYKIDKLWPTFAPLSELRFSINDKIYDEGTVRLNSFTTEYQNASLVGYDITNFIEKEVNVSMSFELFIKDSFELNETYNISFDDVYLYIELITIGEDLSFVIYGLLGGIVAIISFMVVYFKVLQYPPLVRKIRKLRNKVEKGKKVKSIMLNKRMDLINSILELTTNKLGIVESKSKMIQSNTIEK
ncbi:MAG: hypothetical protein ACFE85_00035 [Candidatus Hodarchaeota archaeon]